VGLMVISDGQFDNALCSGTLINNPDTPENEPYFLTANHCVANQQEALSVEVIWDYRASACDTNDPPALATLPRSNGANLLATNAIVDMTLIELDAVTAGAFGRTYVGYTIRDIVLGEPVVGIHHPQGSHMRISYGTVRKLDVRSYAWENQLEVLWTQGVTEAGSSGSGLFLADGTYLLVGCLSNGPSHSCVDTSGNFDNFASLKVFYPSVQSYLSGTNPGAVGPVCPAKATFKSHPELLAHLRTFRDEGLRKLAWGNRLVDAYYKAAPVLARLVEQSPEARDAFMVASAPFATVGRMLTR